MKKATLKNIEHLQQAISVQKNCAATICTHINNILPCINKLEQTVLKLQKRITTDHDRVHLNALDYDPDIDGPPTPRRHVNTAVVSVQDHFTPSEPDILDVAESQAEDYSAEESPDSIHHNSEVSHGPSDFSSDIQDTSTTAHQNTTKYNAYSDEIPELEEDWDAESTLITHHNTHSESEQIRWDYTQQLLDLTNNQYYKEETSDYQLQYSSPDPDYYSSSTRRTQKPPCDPNGYYPPPPDPADVQCWYA